MPYSSSLINNTQTVATPTVMTAMRNFLVTSMGWTEERAISQEEYNDRGQHVGTSGQPLVMTLSKAGIGALTVAWFDEAGTTGRFKFYAHKTFDPAKNYRTQGGAHAWTGYDPDEQPYFFTTYSGYPEIWIDFRTQISYYFFGDADAITMIIRTPETTAHPPYRYRAIYLGKIDNTAATGPNFAVIAHPSNLGVNSSVQFAKFVSLGDSSAIDAVFLHPPSRLIGNLAASGARNLNDDVARRGYAVKTTIPQIQNSGNGDRFDSSGQYPLETDFRLRKVGSPTGNVRISIYRDYVIPGQPSTSGRPYWLMARSGTIAASSLTTNVLTSPAALQTFAMTEWAYFVQGDNNFSQWSYLNAGASQALATTFKLKRNTTVNSVRLRLHKDDSPPGNITFRIAADSGGVPGATVGSVVTVPTSDLSTDQGRPFYIFDGLGAVLTANTTYWGVIETDATYKASTPVQDVTTVRVAQNNSGTGGLSHSADPFTTSTAVHNGVSWTATANQGLLVNLFEFGTNEVPFFYNEKIWIAVEVVGGAVDGSNYIQVADDVGSNAYVFDGTSYSALGVRSLTFAARFEYWSNRNAANGASTTPRTVARLTDNSEGNWQPQNYYDYMFRSGYRTDVDTHAMMPIIVGLKKTSGNVDFWPAGSLHNVRLIRTDNLTVEGSIFQGLDEWIIFPQQTSPTQNGFVVKKVI